MLLARIAGIPVEETLPVLLPLVGVASVAARSRLRGGARWRTPTGCQRCPKGRAR